MLSDGLIDDSQVERRSLRDESWNEACAEKWYRSKQAGYDVGEKAIRDWVREHWDGFLRARVIEHMLGIRFWLELNREHFGLARRIPAQQLPIFQDIIARLLAGSENLDLILWLRQQPPAIRPVIRELLMLININSYRLKCHFADM